MPDVRRQFQVFAKPAGAICNLDCHYCYYLEKEQLFPVDTVFRMSDSVLESYVVQHIEASPDETVSFSWHGGEPTTLGLDYFRNIVALQRKHCPAGRSIHNGIQTNGTLLDEAWGRFLAAECFTVGLSMDGPADLHDPYRVTKGGQPTHAQAMRGYDLLVSHGVPCEILCVVHARNVDHPLEVYRFFKQIGAQYMTFLPLVERFPDAPEGVGEYTVPAGAFGEFLCAIFDEWKREDIGKVKVQIFEEAARTAFAQQHTLCIFRETCGDVPVVEHNGDFYSCDHYVNAEHRVGNITEAPLVQLLEAPAQRVFGQAKLNTLPQYCLDCEVRAMCNGGCPKNRFIRAPDGEPGLNYLCAGYKQFFTHCGPFVQQVAAMWKGNDQQSVRGQVAQQP
jgi:uncharacterized protein